MFYFKIVVMFFNLMVFCLTEKLEVVFFFFFLLSYSGHNMLAFFLRLCFKQIMLKVYS